MPLLSLRTQPISEKWLKSHLLTTIEQPLIKQYWLHLSGAPLTAAAVGARKCPCSCYSARPSDRRRSTACNGPDHEGGAEGTARPPSCRIVGWRATASCSRSGSRSQPITRAGGRADGKPRSVQRSSCRPAVVGAATGNDADGRHPQRRVGGIDDATGAI